MAAFTYASPVDAYHALLEANPRLVELLEGVGGAACVGRGLRAVNATAEARDGSPAFEGFEPGVDAIASYLGRSCASLGSLANAIKALMPGTVAGRRPEWADVPRVFPVLQDAIHDAGGDFAIQPPYQTIEAQAALEDAARLEDWTGQDDVPEPADTAVDYFPIETIAPANDNLGRPAPDAKLAAYYRDSIRAWREQGLDPHPFVAALAALGQSA